MTDNRRSSIDWSDVSLKGGSVANNDKAGEDLTVGEAFELARETRRLLERADQILDTLTNAGVRKPSVLGDLIEPTSKIRNALRGELEELEEIVRKPPAEQRT
jgi:hypothetical protein